MKKNILNQKLLISGLIILLITSACSTKEKHRTETKIETPVETKPVLVKGSISNGLTKNGSSYSYFIPNSFDTIEKLPVIIFVDPHAKGNYPVEKYKALADSFHFILLGSNDSKNGMEFEQSNKIVADLLNEATTALPGNTERISLAGFSGGAKAVIVCANTVPGFSSAIYCGAALPSGSIEIKIPMLAFAGSHDMNYTEVRNFNFSLDQTNISHTLVEWNGKHEWPDSVSFIHAFYWSIFNSMKNKKIEKNGKLIGDFKKMVDAAMTSEKDLLKKSLLMKEEIAMLNDIESVNNFKNKLTALENSPAFKDASRKQSQILAYEDDRKKEIINSFENRNLDWWSNQITLLSADKKSQSNQRILGYISLASWSFSSKAVAANNFQFAKKALQIYKLADPENSEQPFLEACLYSKNGMPDSAVYFLNEAINLGLDDRGKIENEKDLFTLRGRSDYLAALGKMK